MSLSSIELFIASTNDLYIIFFLHQKRRVTRTGMTSLLLKVKYNDYAHTLQGVDPLCLSKSASSPNCLELPPLCGRCGSFPSLPCRGPTSSPLMWLRCIAALHFIMSLLITYPVLGNVLWWPSNIQAVLQGVVGGQAYIWHWYAFNEMLDIIKPWLGVSLSNDIMYPSFAMALLCVFAVWKWKKKTS